MRYASFLQTERIRQVFCSGVLACLLATASAVAQPSLALPPIPSGFDAPPATSVVLLHRTLPATPPLPAAQAWFGFDKVQHFTFSFLFTVGSQYVLVNKADLGEGPALPVSAGISAGIGVAKELYDRRRPGGTGFSYQDLVWDAAGIAAASLLIAL